MIRRGTFFAFMPPALAAVVACSAGAPPGSSGLSGGNTGSGARGGGGGIGAVGSGGSAAQGTGGTGGGIAVGGSSGDSSGTGGMPLDCPSLTAHSTPVVPTMMLLVDNSSSMFEKSSTGQTPWELLYDALMDPTNGVVKPLADEIRFGFMSYKGQQGTSETDPKCAILTPAMPTFTTGNYDAINQVYSALGTEVNNGPKWETPTGFAVNAAASALAAFTSDPPGPKYILLVTDGNPNTCQTLDPQCGQDRAIKAVQDAYAAGIGTFAIGIGSLVDQPNDGCNAPQVRCGMDHLQDIANAGAGLPVVAPPADYQYQPCVANEGAVLTATYAADGETPGDAVPFATNDGAELRQHLSELLTNVQSCTFDLDAVVTGDPSTASSVTLNGTPLAYGDTAAGWTLEANHYQVTLQGSACVTYRSMPGSTLDISFQCDASGEPIAQPR